MLLRRFREIAILLLVLLLAACGGGDDDGVFNPGESDIDDPDAVSGRVTLLTSTPRIGTGGADSATIRALVKSESGILLPDVEVDFSVSDNGTLEVVQSTTDESGSALASLNASGDARNRTVTVTAAVGSSRSSVDVDITGTGLSISGPSTVPLGDTSSYTISLKDSENRGIARETLSASFAKNAMSASSLSTDANGNVIVQMTANSGGTDTLTARAFTDTVSTSHVIEISNDSFQFVEPNANAEIGLGEVATVAIDWQEDGNPIADGEEIIFSTTRGRLTQTNVLTSGGSASTQIQADNAGPAVITATTPSGLTTKRSIEFYATTPAAIETKAESTQVGPNGQSEITATVRDANNNLVKNQNITFELTDRSGGEISNGSAVTNSQGIARTVYTAGQTTSARDAVEIRAYVTANSSIENTVYLTVAQRALRIALGTGNEIFEPNTTTYNKPWVVIVTDANGGPIDKAKVELSLLPTAFIKGRYILTADNDWARQPAASCPREDENLNGIVDLGEDKNGNGVLDPTNPGSVPGSITTGPNGSFEFQLTYPQDRCGWVEVELQAKIEVDGTETTDTANFVLSCASSDLSDADVEPPGGTVSLYGQTSDCTSTD